MRRLTRHLGRMTLSSAVIAAAMPVLDAPQAGAASCADLIFADGFHSGDTSRWAGSPDPARTSGTWTFELDFDGTTRALALELYERPSGAIAGYLLGGTAKRVVVAGSATGGVVSLELELASPGGTRTITIAGALGDETITGTATGDIAPQPVTLERTSCELFELQVAAAVDLGGGPEHLRVLSVVLDGDGAFVAGSWVGEDDCDLWGCDGGLTSYSEIGDVITIGLETDGGCSAGSSMTVSWNPGNLYSGAYTFTDCLGTTSGPLIAATGMGTTTFEVRQVLAARLAIATALEAGAPLTGPIPGVSPTFLNFGKTEPMLRAEVDAEIAGYTGITVDLERVREVYTRVHPRALPDIVQPFGLRLGERRTGTPTGGGAPVTYRDTVARPVIDDLALVDLEPEGWRVVGNRAAGLDLPFASTAPPGAGRLVAPTPGGPVWVSIGPYGGHFGPLTGDPSGEAKANFVGFLAEDDGDMEELLGDGDGIREPGETWGFPVGGDPIGDAVRLRRPPFIAPADGEVGSVRYEEGPSPIHFDNEPQWKIELMLPGQVRYAIGHLGRIAPPLAALVLAATGIDPGTFAGPPGTDLLAGHDPIPVAAGTELALPQLLADEVPGFPGYWVGGGSFLEWPWAQIEFQVPFHLDGDLGADFCVYRFFEAARRAELQAVVDADMLDPDSQRYRDRPFYERWMWTAQGGLCQAENPLPTDFSDLYTRFGGWFERDEPGVTVDELFSFVPIDRTSAVYDPANYDSSSVTHLVIRNLQPGPYSWPMPDGTTALVFLAVGEVLEHTADAMLVKWRDLNLTNPVVYQRLAYLLDGAGLTVEWGNLAASPGAALPPTLLPGDPCDDVTVLCYDHRLGAWPP
ncbi:MAG: hypothetical protein MUC56_17465 [Thermoanaerobaculales bacterium]|nr:hypothetical protein [Thermoanaerobaculales bacterium]